MRKAYMLIILGLVVLAGAAFLGIATGITPKMPLKTSTTVETGAAGGVDAEIVFFRPSPDSSRIALLLVNENKNRAGKEKTYLYSTAIFDEKKHRIVSQSPRSSNIQPREMVWSPDGKTVAVLAGKVYLLNITGEWKELDVDGPVDSLIWRKDAPTRFLYISEIDRKKVFEYDTASDNHADNDFGKYLIDLFYVKGIPCVSYLSTEHLGVNSAIYADEVFTRRRVVGVPLAGLGIPSECNLKISPDGRYFHLATTTNFGVINIVAATPDAKGVSSDLRRAIMVQYSDQDSFRVIWPKQEIGETSQSLNTIGPDEEKALVDTGLSGFTLGLRRAAEVIGPPSLRCITLTAGTQRESKGETGKKRYLALTNRGLEICTYSNGFQPTAVLLSHQLQEQ